MKSLIGLGFLALLTIVVIPSVDGRVWPPWLHICMPNNGKKYYIPNVSACPSGYLFKAPISGFCVCGHGVYGSEYTAYLVLSDSTENILLILVFLVLDGS